jgi:hypothetical protein
VLIVVAIITAVVVWATPPDADARLLARIDEARASFDASGIDDYEVTVTEWCFGCGGDYDRFRLTVEDGELVRIVARGEDRATGKPISEEWDEVPDSYEYSWIKRWGPIDRAFTTMTAAVGGDSKDGPAAMYVGEGDHVRVTTISFTPTGVPRKYSTYITNTYDSGFSVTWSDFEPLR